MPDRRHPACAGYGNRGQRFAKSGFIGKLSDYCWIWIPKFISQEAALEISGCTIQPAFQPYHCLSKNEFRAGELLTRPDFRGLTEEFFANLSVEEQYRILEWQLDLQSALKEAGQWQVSINVNNELFEAEAQRDRFLSLVADYGGPITFEFTETHPMPPIEASNHLLRSLRELGHKSALDDFGTGLNGISLLTDYDFDVIKIDRSLIADLPDRVEKTQTIRLVREMLDILGKEHVVEGVESEEVFISLRDLGFHTFQGFYFARPTDLGDFGVSVEEIAQ